MLRLATLLLPATLLLGQDALQPPAISYEVDCLQAPAGRVTVTMHADNLPPGEIVASIPAWAPGSYRLQHFWKAVGDVAATIDGKAAKVVKLDDQTWKVEGGPGRRVSLSYPLTLDKNSYGDTWYDCIGPATFFYIRDRLRVPHSVRFTLPPGWKVATGLDLKEEAYVGRDYDTFIDAPAMIGIFDLLEFDELGTRYQLANLGPAPDKDDFGLGLKKDTLEIDFINAGSPADKAGLKEGDLLRRANGKAIGSFADLAKSALKLFEAQAVEIEVDRGTSVDKVTLTMPARIDAAKLVEVHRRLIRPTVEMYGGKAPFDRYVFLNYYKARPGGGGLEHLNSCHIVFNYELMKIDPFRIAGLNSHEFVHAWNVKRIRPAELGPFDYTKEVPSRHLWLCEGCTSYYGNLALARAKIWTERRYLDHLVEQIDAVNGESRRRSIEDYSEKVWSRPTNFYYTKGEVLGALIDLKIRAVTKNAKSFDDVMRHLYAKYVSSPEAQKQGWIGVGFPKDGILEAINEVSGADFGDFYAKHIRGTEELPYAEVFAAAGLDYAETTRKAHLGLTMRRRVVREVEEGGPSAKAGLKQGDRLVSLGGRKVEDGNLNDLLQSLEAGKETTIVVDREGKELELKITPVLRDKPGITLKRGAGATELQKAIVDGWLGASKGE